LSSLVAFAAGTFWIVLSARLGLIPWAILVPVGLILLASPVTTRPWWPAQEFAVWIRHRQVAQWTQVSGHAFSREGALAWLRTHESERSWTTIAAMGLVERPNDVQALLDVQALASPEDRWRMHSYLAMNQIAKGHQPDLAGLESVSAALPQDDGDVRGRRAFVAYLVAWNETRLGGDGPDLLAAAARKVGPFKLPLYWRYAMWARRLRLPIVLFVVELLIYALVTAKP
jgi:hypothetical protein